MSKFNEDGFLVYQGNPVYRFIGWCRKPEDCSGLGYRSEKGVFYPFHLIGFQGARYLAINVSDPAFEASDLPRLEEIPFDLPADLQGAVSFVCDYRYVNQKEFNRAA